MQLDELQDDGNGNLIDDSGKIIIPREKRQQTEVYSRVVGYLRPVRQWNKGKQAEWRDRVDFDLERAKSLDTTH